MARLFSRAAFGLAVAAVFGHPGSVARAQGYVTGSLIDRGAYRTPAQWNNGPYYTAPHWNPYAPRPAIWTGLIYNEPLAPPYNNHPRGKFPTYHPERAPLYNYAEGFAPFSGYSAYFERRFGFTPTEQDLARAAVAY